MRCQNCDADLPATTRFCPMCGAAAPHATAMPAAPYAPTPYPPPPPASYAPPAPSMAPPYPPPASPPAPYPPYAPAPGTPYVAPPGAASANIQFAPQINVNVAAPSPYAPAPASTTVVVSHQSGPGLFVRAVWFIFFGLWLGALWMSIAWLLNVSIIGLPLGLLMINRLPQVMTLKPSTQHTTVVVSGATTIVTTGVRRRQRPFALRAVYFLLVGWWASGLWMALAWLAAAFIVTLPLAFIMFDSVPAITTLRVS